jgi:hypothetical protein
LREKIEGISKTMSNFSSIHHNISGTIAALGHSIQNLTSVVTSKDNNESKLEKVGYLIRRGLFKQWVRFSFTRTLAHYNTHSTAH